MPEREVIRKKLAELPLVPAGEKPTDEQMWIGEEHGVSFRVKRYDTYISEIDLGMAFYTLTVTGENKARETLVKDFIDATRPPDDRHRFGDIYNISWALTSGDETLSSD